MTAPKVTPAVVEELVARARSLGATSVTLSSNPDAPGGGEFTVELDGSRWSLGMGVDWAAAFQDAFTKWEAY